MQELPQTPSHRHFFFTVEPSRWDYTTYPCRWAECRSTFGPLRSDWSSRPQGCSRSGTRS